MKAWPNHHFGHACLVLDGDEHDFRGFDAEVYRPWFTKHVAIDLSRLEYQAKPVPIWLAGMTNDAAASAG